MNRILIRTLLAHFIWIWGLAALAGPCDEVIRDTSYRKMPTYGTPKESMVDYKLLNQIMMSLIRATHEHRGWPDGFQARTVSPTWKESPVHAVELTGILHSPHHALAESEIVLTIEREGQALVLRIRCQSERLIYEWAITHDTYSKEIARHIPRPGYSLSGLIRAIQANPTLEGWTLISTEAD